MYCMLYTVLLISIGFMIKYKYILTYIGICTLDIGLIWTDRQAWQTPGPSQGSDSPLLQLYQQYFRPTLSLYLSTFEIPFPKD